MSYPRASMISTKVLFIIPSFFLTIRLTYFLCNGLLGNALLNAFDLYIEFNVVAYHSVPPYPFEESIARERIVVNTEKIICSPFYSFWNFRLLTALPPVRAAGRKPPPGVYPERAPRPLSIEPAARDSTTKTRKTTLLNAPRVPVNKLHPIDSPNPRTRRPYGGNPRKTLYNALQRIL
jgi:hypothetical protein